MKSLLYGMVIRPIIATPSLAALLILLAGGTSGQAADGTWTLNGTGVWSDIANWNSGVGPVATGTGFTATFSSGGTTTAHLDSARTIGNLTFSTAGTYILDNNGSSSNILTLDATTPTINVAASTTATISAEIAGTAGLTKANAGGSASILVLSGANTYSGTTTISGGSAGYIQINANSGLGTSDLLINAANGGLRFGGAFIYSHNTVFGNSGGRFDTNGNNVTISSDLSGTIAGGSSLIKVGTGTLTLAGNNTIGGAGGVNVSAGALSIDSNARLGSGSGPLTLNGGTIIYGAAFNDLRSITLGNSDGTLDTNGFNVSYSQTITGIAGQDLTKSGAGTLTITTAQSYLGATNVNVGTLLINGDNSAATGNVSVAALATLGGSGTIGGAVSVAATGILAPGTGVDSTSTLSLATKNLTMSNVNSKIALDIDGTTAGSFDKVAGINAFSLNGDITFTLTGAYGTASWDVFDFASKTGNFDTVVLTGSYAGSLTRGVGDIWTNANIGGQAWQFDQSSGILSVVPEPSTVALVLAGGMLTVGLIRRRTRKATGESIES